MKKIILLLLFFVFAMKGFAQLSEKVGIGAILQIDSTRGYKLPRINSVVPKSPAQNAGLQAGDLILKVDGQSTKDKMLNIVVDLFFGMAGTEAKLVIERNGSSLNYSIKRVKYNFPTSYYNPVLKGNAFGDALTKLMNDAGYDFDNVIDTLHYTEGKGMFSPRFYECTVKVPGASKVSIASSFGKTCKILFGTYKTTDEVNVAGQALITQIKTFYPEFYYEPFQNSNGTVSVQIGNQLKVGYESAILELNYSFNDSLKAYLLYLDVNGGKTFIYRNIPYTSVDNRFGKAVLTIYNDISQKFKNVKGTYHENERTGLITMQGGWYDIAPVPEGAQHCSINSGSFSFSNGCSCYFYVGDNHEEALKASDAIYEALLHVLGSEFVLCSDRSKFDMDIPENAEVAINFGKKKGKEKENLPAITLVLYKLTDNRYAVNLLFHTTVL